MNINQSIKQNKTRLVFTENSFSDKQSSYSKWLNHQVFDHPETNRNKLGILEAGAIIFIDQFKIRLEKYRTLKSPKIQQEKHKQINFLSPVLLIHERFDVQ